MAKTTKKNIKAVKAKKPIESLYSVQIKIMGKPFSSTGATLKEALCNLKVGSAKGVSILTVTKGSISRHKILTPPQTFRLFSVSKLMHEASLKQVSSFFDL